jgi:hypothetical protein
MYFLVALTSVFLFLITRIALGYKLKSNANWMRILFASYLILIAIFIIALFASKYNYYLKGYRSTSLLFIAMTAIGTLYWLVDRDKVFNNGLRAILFCITILTLPLSALLTDELIGDYQKQLVYDDNTYRLEFTRRGIGEPCILPSLFVKEILFEQKYLQPESSYRDCLEDVKLSKVDIQVLNDSQIHVNYIKLKNDSSESKNVVSVIYKKK